DLIVTGVQTCALPISHAQQREARIATDELDIAARRPRDLAAPPRLQLHVVDDGADGDVLQRHGIARLDVGALAGDDLVARLKALDRKSTRLNSSHDQT